MWETNPYFMALWGSNLHAYLIWKAAIKLLIKCIYLGIRQIEKQMAFVPRNWEKSKGLGSANAANSEESGLIKHWSDKGKCACVPTRDKVEQEDGGMLMLALCTDLLSRRDYPVLQFRGAGENTNHPASQFFARNPARGGLMYLRAAGVLSS